MGMIDLIDGIFYAFASTERRASEGNLVFGITRRHYPDLRRVSTCGFPGNPALRDKICFSLQLPFDRREQIGREADGKGF